MLGDTDTLGKEVTQVLAQESRQQHVHREQQEAAAMSEAQKQIHGGSSMLLSPGMG